MNPVSASKLAVSWIVSTILLLVIGASFHALFHADPTLEMAGTLSTELTLPFTVALFATINLIVHCIFYFAGFNSSPIRKGFGISMSIGFAYMMVILLCTNIITVHAAWHVIGVNLIAIATEMAVLGLAVSVLSISEIHRWGIFRWV